MGDYDFSDGEIYSDSVEMTYVVNIDDIASSYAINRGSRAMDYLTVAQVYFYNVNTGDYDLVFDDSNVVELTDYIAPNGELRARFTCEGEMAEETWSYGVPYIYVFGGESDVEN